MFSVAGRLDDLRRQDRPPRRQREAALQRAGAGVLPMGPAARRVPEPRAGRRSGTSAARTTRQRRVRPPDRRRPGADDAHVIRGETLEELAAGDRRARSTRYAAVTGGLALADGLRRRRCRRTHRALQRLRRDRARTRTSAAASAPVEQLFNGAVKEEPGRTNPTMWPIADDGPVLRRARHRRHARHQGRPEAPTPTARSLDDIGPADPGPLRRRQLRRLGLRRAPTGRAARRSARSSPSPTAPPARRTPKQPVTPRAPTA